MYFAAAMPCRPTWLSSHRDPWLHGLDDRERSAIHATVEIDVQQRRRAALRGRGRRGCQAVISPVTARGEPLAAREAPQRRSRVAATNSSRA